MDTMKVVLVLLIGLVVLAGVQAVELLGVKADLAVGAVGGQVNIPQGGAAATRYSAPSAPQMVGGC